MVEIKFIVSIPDADGHKHILVLKALISVTVYSHWEGFVAKPYVCVS